MWHREFKALALYRRGNHTLDDALAKTQSSQRQQRTPQNPDER